MSGGGALREVVQVVPRLPPPAEGLGGYALALAGALRRQHGVASRFVAAASMPRTAGALCDLLLNTAPGLPVLLQYAGYGYQSRGCPVWLLDGLEAWKRGSPNRRLVTFFHEVHAMGPPWRSSFWTSPVQRRLAARLTRLSDATATSLDLYAGLLRRWGPRRDPVVLPVVSNIGEPAVVPLLSARPPRLVVFGGAGNRSKVYGRHLAELAAVCRALAVREVADIGPEIALPAALPAAGGEIPIVRLGLLSEAEASAALLASRAGFLAYPASFLGKSGVLAAYAAHGVAPVCTTAAPPASGLTAGVHYLPAAQILPCPDLQADLQMVSDAARAWYAGHALHRHADLLSGLLACAS